MKRLIIATIFLALMCGTATAEPDQAASQRPPDSRRYLPLGDTPEARQAKQIFVRRVHAGDIDELLKLMGASAGYCYRQGVIDFNQWGVSFENPARYYASLTECIRAFLYHLVF